MNIKAWLIAIFIVAVTVISLGFVKFQQIQAAMQMADSFPEPSATVNTHTTALSSYQKNYQVTGEVVATQVVSLQNELPGTIEKVNFDAGDTVTKGQLLLTLDTSQEQAQLSASQATLLLTKSSLERITTLFEQDKISQQEYDTAQAQYKIAQANTKHLKSVIAKKHIYAPFSGTLSLATYQVGQFLPAYSHITTLVGKQPTIWVDFQLPQTKQQLKVGDNVFVSNINEGSRHTKVAKIIAVNSQIKSQSRHLQYRAQLDNADRWLKHNEIVKIKVLEAPQNIILVPSSSISRDHFGNYVFQLIENDKKQYRAKRITVELGIREQNQQVILSGLSTNVLISTDGTFKLREGLLVYPVITEQALTLQGEMGVNKA